MRRRIRQHQNLATLFGGHGRGSALDGAPANTPRGRGKEHEMKLRILLSSATGGLALLLANVANAEVPGSDWRQVDRTIHFDTVKASPQSFAFEARFGPYQPNVDSAFSDKHPYRDYFGD